MINNTYVETIAWLSTCDAEQIADGCSFGPMPSGSNAAMLELVLLLRDITSPCVAYVRVETMTLFIQLSSVCRMHFTQQTSSQRFTEQCIYATLVTIVWLRATHSSFNIHAGWCAMTWRTPTTRLVYSRSCWLYMNEQQTRNDNSKHNRRFAHLVFLNSVFFPAVVFFYKRRWVTSTLNPLTGRQNWRDREVHYWPISKFYSLYSYIKHVLNLLIIKLGFNWLQYFRKRSIPLILNFFRRIK